MSLLPSYRSQTGFYVRAAQVFNGLIPLILPLIFLDKCKFGLSLMVLNYKVSLTFYKLQPFLNFPNSINTYIRYVFHILAMYLFVASDFSVLNSKKIKKSNEILGK